ncbi:MAG: aryl-sulfate sulfotransferase [Alphaproteobacteria bacterium]|nr:aryl-sulfate sulfotransferase [Alphaproteobacteria bacterium]MCB9699077.1 aryl-sulfate sulfotransferase [Alphaproteobacteria bacterium]
MRFVWLLALVACADRVAVRPTDNELRFVVETDVPESASARVTVWPEDRPSDAFFAGEQPGPEVAVVVSGLRFDTAYVARLDTVEGSAILSSVELPFRTGPPSFELPTAAVRADPDAEVAWVLLNFAQTSGGRSDLMLVLDSEGEVVWYEDVASFDPDADDAFWDGYRWDDARAELLAIIGHRRVVAIGLDGEVRADHGTGPLVSHDVLRVGDRLLLPTTRPFDGPDGRWLEDGWLEVDPDGTEREHWLRELGLSPTADPPFTSAPTAGRYWGSWVGGADVLDWTHVNALEVQEVDGTERVLLSLKNLDQLVRADATAGVLDWRMGDSGAGGTHSPGDFRWVGEGPWFAGQHTLDLAADGTLWLFDNGNHQAGPAERDARVLQLAWDEGGRTVEALRTHDLGRVCPFRGSALPLAGDQVLAACGATPVVQAWAPDGRITWEATFSCPESWPSCSLYRAFPLPSHARASTASERTGRSAPRAGGGRRRPRRRGCPPPPASRRASRRGRCGRWGCRR